MLIEYAIFNQIIGVVAVVFIIGFYVITKQQALIRHLEQISKKDDLTNVLNRRYFIEKMEHEIRRSLRDPRDSAFILIDIDHFKEVNDKWGHQCGDYVLQQVVRIISLTARSSDIVGRYGGEEFVVFSQNISNENAIFLGERIRSQIQKERIVWDEHEINITVSVGVTTLKYGAEGEYDKFNSLFKKADTALYAAKRNGRNCVKFVY